MCALMHICVIRVYLHSNLWRIYTSFGFNELNNGAEHYALLHHDEVHHGRMEDPSYGRTLNMDVHINGPSSALLK